MPTACAYCGKTVERAEREHVIPRCLYPKSKAGSRVQRLVVPACSACNSSWSADEAHFRDIVLMSGPKNRPVEELWSTKVRRSFEKVDGHQRLRDIVAQMVPVTVEGQARHKVYPGKDPRVIRVIKKIVRGLCHYHGLRTAVSDKEVRADVMKYQVPPALLEEMPSFHREADIFEYRYSVLNDRDVHSAWLMTFFARTRFMGIVSASRAGFLNAIGNRST